MKETMNILTSTDENYAPWCGVMLTSLLEQNSDRDIRIYIMGDDLSVSSKEKFKSLHKNLTIIDVNWDLFDGFIPPLGAKDYLSRTTWARLGVAEFLPIDINKILYIDADTLVMGSLAELYDTDLTHFAAAAVDEYRDASYLNIDGMYFNAGVVLINVDYFRDNGLFKKFIDFIVNNSHRLRFHDQDVLNKVLEGKVKFLHRKFNMTCCGDVVSEDLRKGIKFIQDREAIDDNDVRIYHYVGRMKPWFLYLYRPRPFDHCWRQVYRRSIWRNFKLQSQIKSPIVKIKIMLNNFLFFTKIKRPEIYKYWTDVYPVPLGMYSKHFFRLTPIVDL